MAESLGDRPGDQRLTQAVLLAAGLGSRLGQRTATMPKCLIEVGGRSLLERSLTHLVRAGFERVVVVTGHGAERIKEAVAAIETDLSIRWVANPRYSETGSAWSLLCGMAALDTGSTLIIESDLLYDPAFLDAAHAAPDQSILIADASGSGDEVHVVVDDSGRIRAFGKQIAGEDRRRSCGEFAGISRIGPRFLAAFRKAVVEDSTGTGSLAGGHYEDTFFAVAGKLDTPLAGLRCPGLAWTEIDDESDLERAITRVLPRLEHADP